MTWKGIITKVSEVDGSGNIEVMFLIKNENDKIVYFPMQTQGSPDDIPKKIETIIRDLRSKEASAKNLIVGQEIIID